MAWEGLAVAVTAAAACVAWTLGHGPDINSDFLTYHLYIGMHAGGRGLADNFFPAGASSYLLPYAHWPLSAMIAAHWPARVVGVAWSILQSTAAIAAWTVALQLFRARTPEGVMLRVSSVLLGILSPLALAAIGSSHVDLLTAIPVVFGLALLLKALRHDSESIDERSPLPLLLAAGACFGAATALKLTNATAAVAAGITLVILMLATRRVRASSVAVFAVGGLSGFALCYGYWGYRLWTEFGNPFFPFFDSAFRAAAPAAVATEAPGTLAQFAQRLWTFRDGLHQRFLPHGWSEWLLRPLYMVDPTHNLYAEVRAPDARFLLLVVLAPIALIVHKRRAAGADRAADSFVPLLLFIAAGWMLWMLLFGNGRYMLPISLVTGAAIVESVRRSLRLWPQRAASVLVLIVVVQAALVIEGSRFRWAAADWQDHWIEADLPKTVTQQPTTFVTFNSVPASWLSLFVHPGSRFINPDAMSITATSDRIRSRDSRLLSEARNLTAVFVYTMVDAASGKPIPQTPASYRPVGIRFGIDIDFERCETGRLIKGRTGGITVTMTAADGRVSKRESVTGYFFCPARYDPSLPVPPIDPTIEAAFDNLEKACPTVLPARTTETVCSDDACYRRYPTTDAVVAISNNGNVHMFRFAGIDQPFLGKLSQLAVSGSGVDCRADLGRYVPFDPGANMLSLPGSRDSGGK